MASGRRRIRFEGIVRGEGQDAEVRSSVTEVSLSGLPTQYVEYRIDWCSKSLPDGDYMMFVHGSQFEVCRASGHWLARR